MKGVVMYNLDLLAAEAVRLWGEAPVSGILSFWDCCMSVTNGDKKLAEAVYQLAKKKNEA
jgi:hypothetical protein